MRDIEGEKKAQAMRTLKAGTAVVDITPPVGTRMGGYRLRDIPSQGIHDPLYAKALILEQDEQRIAILTVDLGAVNKNIVEKTKGLIEDKTGIKKEAILIAASHTHSGPDTFFLTDENLNKTYISILPEYLAGAVYWATNNMQPVKIGVGRGKVQGVSFNRRLKTKDGRVKLNWEKISSAEIVSEGPVDEELGIIKVETLKGKLLAVLINFALHAAVVGPQNLLFSADWPGYTMRLIEKVKKGCIALFTNGAEGNINHIKTPGVWKGTFEEAQRIGTIIGAEALKILARVSTIPEAIIGNKSRNIKIPLRKAPFASLDQLKELIKKEEKQLGEAKSSKLKKDLQRNKEILWIMEQNQTEEEIEIQTITIGDNVLVGIPAEYFVEYGLEIKAKSPFNYTFIVGLANGYIGYIPTLEAFKEGGYEVEFCATSKFVPQAGEIIKKEVLKLINELAKAKNQNKISKMI
ncbi:neutral/alkaline non-lysosomal ceramidase N-terminal domain-containing protein [Candidatus Aerophobetes bacterium]|nr:neutral/alkaline non-lysosomal ceramidase N-terminal domain-containing protein [Candidatus Aerophobetes bacterium]